MHHGDRGRAGHARQGALAMVRCIQPLEERRPPGVRLTPHGPSVRPRYRHPQRQRHCPARDGTPAVVRTGARSAEEKRRQPDPAPRGRHHRARARTNVPAVGQAAFPTGAARNTPGRAPWRLSGRPCHGRDGARSACGLRHAAPCTRPYHWLAPALTAGGVRPPVRTGASRNACEKPNQPESAPRERPDARQT
jgi:hypothetical protein